MVITGSWITNSNLIIIILKKKEEENSKETGVFAPLYPPVPYFLGNPKGKYTSLPQNFTQLIINSSMIIFKKAANGEKKSDFNELERFLSHANFNTAMIYTELVMEDLLERMEYVDAGG